MSDQHNPMALDVAQMDALTLSRAGGHGEPSINDKLAALKAEMVVLIEEAKATRTNQTFRETALATAAALAQPMDDPKAVADSVLAAAERYLAFLRADS